MNPGGSRLPRIKHTQSCANAPIEGVARLCTAWVGVRLTGRPPPHGVKTRGRRPFALVTDVASVKQVDGTMGGPVETDDALDECGCAPSPRERRLLWPSMSRRGALG